MNNGHEVEYQGESYFQLQKYGGRDDGADIMGGMLSLNNVYVSTYCTPRPGCKAARELAVGESTIVEARLSGEHGIYRLVRFG